MDFRAGGGVLSGERTPRSGEVLPCASSRTIREGFPGSSKSAESCSSIRTSRLAKAQRKAMTLRGGVGLSQPRTAMTQEVGRTRLRVVRRVGNAAGRRKSCDIAASKASRNAVEACGPRASFELFRDPLLVVAAAEQEPTAVVDGGQDGEGNAGRGGLGQALVERTLGPHGIGHLPDELQHGA